VIKAEKVSYAYPENGGFRLNNITLNVAPGSFTSLAGPNGAGKTTLIKILAGLIRGYEGTVTLDGKNIQGISAGGFAREVSYIPQTENYVFEFNVYDIVAMGRRPYLGPAGVMKAKDRDAVDEALAAFELTAKRRRKFGSLSGGERRMALIARAMAQEADYLLMDEPTTFLDLAHGHALMEKLAELNMAGRTIFMISHDMNLASEYVKNVVYMKSGRVVYHGTSAGAMEARLVRKVFGIGAFTVQKNPKTGKKHIFLMPGA
jgi:iron complex transport system ATP-binding protein